VFEDKVFANRYKIIKKIDSGGMANIYLANDMKLSRNVALKIMYPQLASDQNFVERFKREAKSMATLSHPYIATVYDWGKEKEIYYMVMEYLSGENLKQIIDKRGMLPTNKVIDISIKICDALEAIHKHGIIHRDIKPSNILITKENNIKITDFGIVKDSAPSLTQTGSILGTAQYISPEQARGLRVEKSSDIYSLGVVIYEMLTGDPPFRGDDSLSVALRHIREKPIPISNIVKNISKNLETVVMGCLSKDPEDRYSSVAKLKEDLIRCRRGLPVEELPKTIKTKIIPETKTFFSKGLQTIKNINRTRVIYFLIVLFFITIFSIIFYQLFITFKTPTPKVVIVPHLENIEFSKAKEQLEKIGLKMIISKQIHNNTFEKGAVISQEPEGGAKIEEGETVYLVISLGSKVTEVPDIVGLKLEEAEKILKETNLKFGIIDEKYSDEVTKNKIITQRPVSGETVPFNTPIYVIVSLGVEKIEVPNVIGMDYETARDILENKQLSVSRIYQKFESVEIGTVISQEPATGVKVFKNSLVTLTLSSGDEMIPIPKVIRENFEVARSTLEESGFEIEEQWVPSSQTTKNLVLNQDPQGGTGAPPGTVIIIYIGSGSL
jgi:serine/threonine-protein kinase